MKNTIQRTYMQVTIKSRNNKEFEAVVESFTQDKDGVTLYLVERVFTLPGHKITNAFVLDGKFKQPTDFDLLGWRNFIDEKAHAVYLRSARRTSLSNQTRARI